MLYSWFNYHKGKYVNIIRVIKDSDGYAQICDEDGDWYVVKISELKGYR